MATKFTPEVKAYRSALRAAAVEAFAAGDAKNTGEQDYMAFVMASSTGKDARGFSTTSYVEVRRYYTDRAEAEAAVAALNASLPERVEGASLHLVAVRERRAGGKTFA